MRIFEVESFIWCKANRIPFPGFYQFLILEIVEDVSLCICMYSCTGYLTDQHKCLKKGSVLSLITWSYPKIVVVKYDFIINFLILIFNLIVWCLILKYILILPYFVFILMTYHTYIKLVCYRKIASLFLWLHSLK